MHQCNPPGGNCTVSSKQRSVKIVKYWLPDGIFVNDPNILMDTKEVIQMLENVEAYYYSSFQIHTVGMSFNFSLSYVCRLPICRQNKLCLIVSYIRCSIRCPAEARK